MYMFLEPFFQFCAAPSWLPCTLLSKAHRLWSTSLKTRWVLQEPCITITANVRGVKHWHINISQIVVNPLTFKESTTMDHMFKSLPMILSESYSCVAMWWIGQFATVIANYCHWLRQATYTCLCFYSYCSYKATYVTRFVRRGLIYLHPILQLWRGITSFVCELAITLEIFSYIRKYNDWTSCY